MSRGFALLAAVVTLVPLAGCREGTPPTSPGDRPGREENYLLSAEPAGARDVLEARKDPRPDEEVVLVGRIGGSRDPFVKGRAAFTLVDLSMKPCTEDGCVTPWDYCCESAKEVARASVTVKFVDREGRTLKRDAQELAGLKPMQVVVVRGRAKPDAEGNFVVWADGVFIRPE